jgi:hypothetical protein
MNPKKYLREHIWPGEKRPCFGDEKLITTSLRHSVALLAGRVVVHLRTLHGGKPYNVQNGSHISQARRSASTTIVGIVVGVSFPERIPK